MIVALFVVCVPFRGYAASLVVPLLQTASSNRFFNAFVVGNGNGWYNRIIINQKINQSNIIHQNNEVVNQIMMKSLKPQMNQMIEPTNQIHKHMKRNHKFINHIQLLSCNRSIA